MGKRKRLAIYSYHAVQIPIPDTNGLREPTQGGYPMPFQMLLYGPFRRPQITPAVRSSD